MRDLPRPLCCRVRKCTSMMNAGKKNILSRGGLVDGRGTGIIGDDGFQIGSLSALLSTIAIGCRGRDTGHLFSFVKDSFCDVNTVHCFGGGRRKREGRVEGGSKERNRGVRGGEKDIDKRMRIIRSRYCDENKRNNTEKRGGKRERS